MMIDSAVWEQYINVTDTQTDSHLTIANAVPTHCVGRLEHSNSGKTNFDSIRFGNLINLPLVHK